MLKNESIPCWATGELCVHSPGKVKLKMMNRN